MNKYHALMKLLLGQQFFEDNAHLAKDITPRGLKPVYDAIEYCHTKYGRDINLQEVWAIYEKQNPTVTARNKEDMHSVFAKIGQTKVGQEVGSDLILSLWQIKQAEKISMFALGIAEGSESDWDSLEELVHIGKESRILELADEDWVTNDINELEQELLDDNKWRFNLDELDASVGSFGAGHVIILAARTDVGKTAAWVSFAFGKGGWVDQGAKVHALCNEEPSNRTKLRGLSAAMELTGEEVLAHKKEAQKVLDKWDGVCYVKDCVGMTVQQVESYVSKHRPDVLIVDQADKIGVSGQFSNETLKLKAIYVGLREIAKKYDCAVMCITQLSADGNHKLYVPIDAMENSKTAKQAEADLILCIGMQDPAFNEGTDTGARMINIGKNKLSGAKKAFLVNLDRHTSRLIP